MEDNSTKYRLIHADSFCWLKEQADHSFHGVITDPPFAVVEFEEAQLQKRASGSGGVWRIPPKIG